MRMNHLVGNDIVDLKTLDALNYPKNLRFVRRVLCEQEQQVFFAHSNSIPLFWMFWAAKEAVFKIIKKIDPHATFSHRSFQVTIEWDNLETASGLVTYREEIHPVTFTITPEWVHCIATNGNHFGNIAYQVSANNEITCDPSDFTPDEMASIFSSESFLVRMLVKNIFRAHNGTNCEVRRRPLIKKFGPPEIWCQGEKKRDIDVSMSHDGNYCAALILFNS